MTTPTRFDDALPKFAALASKVLGERAVLDNFFLRDASGRLTFVATEEITESKHKELIQAARQLWPYVQDGQGAITRATDLFDTTLLEPNVGVFERIEHQSYKGFVRIVERRIVGQDWLEAPRGPIKGVPPVAVFASHKGGVGRSTALAVASTAFAERGYNILVVDLDLEAPGLGDIFLSREQLPTFGTLDYFVESTLGSIGTDFLEEMIAVSPLTKGRGSVHVAPAIGIVGEASPQNISGKIARAYLEVPDEYGNTLTFLGRTRALVQNLSQRFRYDVIFVDVRAGLNESTAASVLGLGGEVLLFGLNSPQTFSGYRYFLSYLARFRPAEFTDADWRARLRMIHAKAGGPKEQSDFRTQAFELFADTLYDQEEGLESTSFNFDYDDPTAPHFAWPILNDPYYFEFNPTVRIEQFGNDLYERTFGTFINSLRDLLELGEAP